MSPLDASAGLRAFASGSMRSSVEGERPRYQKYYGPQAKMVNAARRIIHYNSRDFSGPPPLDEDPPPRGVPAPGIPRPAPGAGGPRARRRPPLLGDDAGPL